MKLNLNSKWRLRKTLVLQMSFKKPIVKLYKKTVHFTSKRKGRKRYLIDQYQGPQSRGAGGGGHVSPNILKIIEN